MTPEEARMGLKDWLGKASQEKGESRRGYSRKWHKLCEQAREALAPEEFIRLWQEWKQAQGQ